MFYSTFLWKREFVHLCGSAKCKVYYDHFGRDWLQRSGWTIGDASAEHESIFLRRGRSTTFQFHQTKPATCGCNPAGSKIENGIFSRREVDQAQLFLVQLVAAGRTERIKIKSQKRKESPMEGSHGVAADRKHKKTDSSSTKAKYFAFLNEESSCHLSQKKIHMSKQNWWWPRTWMSQSVNETFVYYRCRWDSATDIQKSEWESSAPPFRRWTFWRWNVKCVFLWNVTKVQKIALLS